MLILLARGDWERIGRLEAMRGVLMKAKVAICIGILKPCE